ncbi:MAG: EamA family transporter [Patescibacteria group bacterium]|jgi:drug/metabolite transporter (DMT)-like permease
MLIKDFQQKKILYGFVAILAAALLCSLEGVFFRPKLTGIPVSLVVLLEHFFGFVVLTPFLFLGWRKIKNLTKRDWFSLILISIFGGMLGTFMLTKAYFAALDSHTALATVILLQKLQPFFVIFLARLLLKEKFPGHFYFWAIVAVLSAYFLSSEQQGPIFVNLHIANKAAFYAIGAALAYATAIIFGKRLLNHLNPQTTSALRYTVTFIFTLILILATNKFSYVYGISEVQWQALLFVGLVSGALGFIIYYYGLKNTPASLATIAELFWPFSAVILDYFINKNLLNGIQITAAAVLLVSFYFITKKSILKLPTFSALTKPGGNSGKFIGFNTADLDNVDIDLDHGVYAVRALVGDKKYKGLLNFGFRETFGEDQHMELYLPDFAGNYYGISVKVEIVRKIRDIKKFKSAEELKEKIREDLEELKK